MDPDPQATLDLVAASLRADASDLGVFVETLAAKLERALPGRTRVDRRGGLFRGKRVRQLQVQVGDARYVLTCDGGSVEPRRATVVRGVAIRTDDLGLDAWIDALARDLADEAERSEQARLALERLLH